MMKNGVGHRIKLKGGVYGQYTKRKIISERNRGKL